MDHLHHHGHNAADAQTPAWTDALPSPTAPGLNSVAFRATLHCLSGCAVGEVLGMVIGTGYGLSNGTTVVLSIALAFVLGYAFTVTPLLRAGFPAVQAGRLALAADTASITLMEIVDNAVMLLVPGAMQAPLTSWLFWASLAFSLVVAGIAAYPLNRWLISRGKGHAVVHYHHHA
jgi:hypothetical protein